MLFPPYTHFCSPFFGFGPPAYITRTDGGGVWWVLWIPVALTACPCLPSPCLVFYLFLILSLPVLFLFRFFASFFCRIGTSFLANCRHIHVRKYIMDFDSNELRRFHPFGDEQMRRNDRGWWWMFPSSFLTKQSWPSADNVQLFHRDDNVLHSRKKLL